MNQIVKLSFAVVLAILLFPGLSSADTSSSAEAKKACQGKYVRNFGGDNCEVGYDLGKAGKSKDTKVVLWNHVSGSNVRFATVCSKDTPCAGGYELAKSKKSANSTSVVTMKEVTAHAQSAVKAKKSKTSKDGCHKYNKERVQTSNDGDSPTYAAKNAREVCYEMFEAASKKTASSPGPKSIGKAAADAGKTKKDACSRYKNESNKKQCEQAYDTQAQAKKKKESAASAKAKEEAESKDPALDCINNRDKCNLIKKYINPIIAFLTAAVGIAVTIGIISGGIRYASAGDDPGKMNAAKKQIGTALVALFALLVLYAAIRWITPNI